MPYQNDWWQTFYSGHYVDFHLEAVSAKQTAREVDFMLKVLDLPDGANVLDLGCGEGRHALEMAKRGYWMTAVDATAPLLQVARSNAREQGLDIQFKHQDMRILPWNNHFDAAYCVWGSFGLFDEQGNYDLLQAVYQVLRPGGRILIENHSIETLLPNFRDNFWHPVGDDLLRLEQRYFDHKSSRLESNWMFIRRSTGKIEQAALSMRIYTYYELCKLLEQAGFINFAAYDTLTAEPFHAGAHRLTLLATKAESASNLQL